MTFARLGLVLSLTAPALARQEPAPAAGAPDGSDARARLAAEERARYEALVQAVDRFGHAAEFESAARKLLAEKSDRFITVRDGWVTDVALENWLTWNAAKEGEATIPALDFKDPAHPFAAIVDLSRQLRSHGIDFLLVTFPTRPQLYPEFMLDLPSMDGFAGICPGTSKFVLALVDAGVDVLYLAPEFAAARYGEGGDVKDQLFLRSNQHWSPRGAELAARRVAERMAQYPWFKPGAAKEGVDWVVKEKEADVGIVFGGGPKDAKPERLRVHAVVRPDRRKLDYSRPSSPIVLLSGSFADFHRVTECDFTSQLYRFCGWPIDKVNPKGGVEDRCREALAARPPEELAAKKLVIWMLAEQAFRPGPMWRTVQVFKE